MSQLAKSKPSNSPEEGSDQANGEGISLSSYSAEDMVELQSADQTMTFL